MVCAWYIRNFLILGSILFETYDRFLLSIAYANNMEDYVLIFALILNTFVSKAKERRLSFESTAEESTIDRLVSHTTRGSVERMKLEEAILVETIFSFPAHQRTDSWSVYVPLKRFRKC